MQFDKVFAITTTLPNAAFLRMGSRYSMFSSGCLSAVVLLPKLYLEGHAHLTFIERFVVDVFTHFVNEWVLLDIHFKKLVLMFEMYVLPV